MNMWNVSACVGPSFMIGVGRWSLRVPCCYEYPRSVHALNFKKWLIESSIETGRQRPSGRVGLACQHETLEISSIKFDLIRTGSLHQVRGAIPKSFSNLAFEKPSS
jgi:hypothetical protein